MVLGSTSEGAAARVIARHTPPSTRTPWQMAAVFQGISGLIFSTFLPKRMQGQKAPWRTETVHRRASTQHLLGMRRAQARAMKALRAVPARATPNAMAETKTCTAELPRKMATYRNPCHWRRRRCWRPRARSVEGRTREAARGRNLGISVC